MTPLRQRFIDELTRRNYSPRTIGTYVAAVARTAKHFGRSPELLTRDQLRDFQLHLIAHAASWSLFNQVACALRFLYRHVLDRPDFVPFVVFGKKPRTLPVVLGPDDVRRLLDAVPAGRNRLMLRIAYGCGLRVSELTHLQVADIDSTRNILWVRHGKGNKDRGVPLPAQLLDELRVYWREHRPPDWLFAGPTGQPLNVSTLQRAFQQARRVAGVRQRATNDELRRHFQKIGELVVLNAEAGSNTAIGHLHTTYQPILLFSHGKPEQMLGFADSFKAPKEEKAFHPWQRTLNETVHWLSRMADPGQLVVDPFGGGFTTAEAALRLGLRCVSCDIEEESVNVGRFRVAGAWEEMKAAKEP